MQIESIDPISDSSWDQQIRSHQHATIFHSRAWASVLVETYHHRPIYLRASDGGKLAVLLPLMEVRSAITGRRGISLPFTDFCRALIFPDSVVSDFAPKLCEIARGKRWSYLELRGEELSGQDSPASESYFGHRLALNRDVAQVFANFDPSNQRAIRKAERSKLTAEVADGKTAVKEFFNLHQKTRRRHGVPPQSQSFFDAIQRHILEKGLGFIVLVRQRLEAIAAAVFFHLGPSALYKFGASDLQHQEVRPNNLAIWHGIQELTKRGVTELHFGRTSVDQSGLRRFKRSWSAEEHLLRYFKFDLTKNQWVQGTDKPSASLVNNIFRHLPLGANKVAGASIYPHLD